MKAISTFQHHRNTLHNAVVNSLQNSSFSPDIDIQTNSFFRSVEKCLMDRDPHAIAPLLLDWSEALSVSANDLQTAQLPSLINLMFSSLANAISQEITPAEAVDLLLALQPVIDYSYQRSCDLEIGKQLNFVTNQLAEMTRSMKRMERSKSDFIAVAAHELRTPLTLIEGYIAMIDEKINTAYPDFPNRDFIKGIQNGAHRMRATIDDMIDVSIIDNNLLRLNYQPVWIDRLINSLVSEFQPILQDRGITLTIEDPDGFTGMNYGDPERLMQLFRNLLMNAIKYTPDGGKITVCAVEKDHFKELIFQDTGIGIDPSDHAAIFEKFGQVGDPSLHSSGRTKFKGGGAGLGLYIARGIIEAHGGAVWVESPGRDEIKLPGSIFHLVLPILDAPPNEKLASLFRAISQEK